MTPISKRSRAYFYIYTKKKKCKTFIYIYNNPDSFQKARQFTLRFCSQKSIHFTLRNSSWSFWNWYLNIYKKHDTLRYVTFLYTKIQILRKSKTNLRYFFNTKSLTLCGPTIVVHTSLCVSSIIALNYYHQLVLLGVRTFIFLKRSLMCSYSEYTFHPNKGGQMVSRLECDDFQSSF